MRYLFINLWTHFGIDQMFTEGLNIFKNITLIKNEDLENICKWCNQQGINFQNIQTAYTAPYQKNKQPNQKMGKRSK